MKKAIPAIGMAHVCDTIRTRDLLVRSQTLYPAELHTHIQMLYIPANVSPRRVMLPYRVVCVKTILKIREPQFWAPETMILILSCP